MTDQSIKDTIIRELAGLSENHQADVLAFVRFLKIGLADTATTAANFDRAVGEARQIAESRGITGDDIDGEIRAYRASK